MKDGTHYEVWVTKGRGAPQHKANVDTIDDARTIAGYERVMGGAATTRIVEVTRKTIN